MPYFQTAELRQHYLVAGMGETLVLLHGLGSSGADWAFQIEPLGEHFRLIAPDLRGSGLTDAPPGPYQISRFASDVWELLDGLGERQVHLLGFSMGGAVALEMALQRPSQIGRVMTINSLPCYRVNSWRKWLEVFGQLALVKALGLRRTSTLVARRMFPAPHQQSMRERVVSVVGSLPPQQYLHSVRALIGWSAIDRLHDLHVPMLMLAAEHDYTPLAEKHLYAKRSGAQIAVVRGSRHGTPFDAIDASNACALAFFRDLPLPTDDVLVTDAPDRTPMTVTLMQ
ncbi:MAG: alpha/beta hydrolase [Dokdonella sp.]